MEIKLIALTPEEKRKIYEEEKERAKAQEKIKKKTKPSTWGCLILIFIVAVIWLGNILTPSKKEVVSEKSVTKIQKPIPKITQEDEKLLRELINTGLVEKINPKWNEVFVNPFVWTNLKYEDKEAFARFLAVYCGKKEGTDTYWVDIKDSYSGKKLAKYSSWGFKVY